MSVDKHGQTTSRMRVPALSLSSQRTFSIVTTGWAGASVLDAMSLKRGREVWMERSLGAMAAAGAEGRRERPLRSRRGGIVLEGGTSTGAACFAGGVVGN
jgi:hypothetical protein